MRRFGDGVGSMLLTASRCSNISVRSRCVRSDKTVRPVMVATNAGIRTPSATYSVSMVPWVHTAARAAGVDI